ncbi:Hypothetical predicted protein [Paramuricea clavata]|uniref:Uncharacterized protein n=1 Tax=Paramuricea clavata TaxID=317549 RepID=A0A6S7LP65_PARCT|nr:Hypothetical predicted protein [Paramuricea clavata]
MIKSDDALEVKHVAFADDLCGASKLATTDLFTDDMHDEIRDLLATVINEVAYDVSTEPALTPLTGEVLPPSANSADHARVDIAARGFWQRCEKAFFDVRVFNPYAPTLDARVS